MPAESPPRLDRLETSLRAVLGAGTGLILAAIAAICFVEVVLRYGFGSSFRWYDEFVGYLLVWLTFFGAVLAQSYRQHIGIENLVESTSGSTEKVLKLTNHALMIAIHLVLLFYGSELVTRFLREDAITLPIPIGLVYVVIPASAALMLVIEAVHVARLLALGRPSS